MLAPVCIFDVFGRFFFGSDTSRGMFERQQLNSDRTGICSNGQSRSKPTGLRNSHKLMLRLPFRPRQRFLEREICAVVSVRRTESTKGSQFLELGDSGCEAAKGHGLGDCYRRGQRLDAARRLRFLPPVGQVERRTKEARASMDHAASSFVGSLGE
jgi:hypothetical protein